IAELGLPLRLGEASPRGEPVLAGLACPEANVAWSALTKRNTRQRPTALLWPFGGKPLKGYVERKFDDLADQIRTLIAEGFYVIVQPNGMPWGSADHVQRVLDRLALQERDQAEIGPDPADGSGYVTYRGAGTHTVPYASYVMHLVTYFVRFAELIVTVEGWMMHAAYCLGKRYRVLMLPDSPTEWLPYGRTVRQDVVVQSTSGIASPPRVTANGDPPLAE